ncbi:hypothetical protein V8C37DRAFT_292383 [Trichoderma ceciliae]
MSLCRMPFEILRLIAVNLDPDDLFHLAMSSHQFQHIIDDTVICQRVMEHIRFSLEYKEGYDTKKYAKALRRLVKRREALQMARPFHLLEVSKEAVHFTYTNRAVCYTTKQTSPAHRHHLWILLLRCPSVKEVCIDVLQLIEASDISDFEENRPYHFKPLYHADGIVTCVYEQRKSPASGRWLIIYSLEKKKILNSRLLRSTANIFVRNNDRFLYYGTRSELVDGQRRWVLHGFSLKESKWLSRRTILLDLVGSDIGSTMCFEIFGDHLYGVSSQEPTELEDTEWPSAGRSLNSFYYAFRFPLGDHSTIQILPRSSLWRRGATDGPIDDRWNHLQLRQDEKSGQVSIFETRKEWLSCWSRRTCYRKQLFYPPAPRTHSIDGQTDDRTDDQCYEGWNDMVRREPSPEDSVHRGDDGFSSSTFDFRNSPVRSYSPNSQAFVDIVRTTTASSPTTKRLRLRVRRRLCPTFESDQPPSSPDSVADAENDLEDQEVRLWPTDLGDERPDEALDHHVDGLLNPQEHFDEVDWAMDEGVLVYSPRPINHPDEPRSIVLVSFDPALHFPGLCQWNESSTPPCPQGSHPGKDDYAPQCGSAHVSGRSITTRDREIAAPEPPRIRGLDLTKSTTRMGSAVHPERELHVAGGSPHQYRSIHVSSSGCHIKGKARPKGAFMPNTCSMVHI